MVPAVIYAAADHGAAVNDLFIVIKTLYWLSAAPNVLLVLQPHIKLFQTLLKPDFAASRFPGLQIRHSDDLFLPDPNCWNVIFLNDSTKMARRIAGLKGCIRNIEDLLLFRALNCLLIHS